MLTTAAVAPAGALVSITMRDWAPGTSPGARQRGVTVPFASAKLRHVLVKGAGATPVALNAAIALACAGVPRNSKCIASRSTLDLIWLGVAHPPFHPYPPQYRPQRSAARTTHIGMSVVIGVAHAVAPLMPR